MMKIINSKFEAEKHRKTWGQPLTFDNFSPIFSTENIFNLIFVNCQGLTPANIEW